MFFIDNILSMETQNSTIPAQTAPTGDAQMSEQERMEVAMKQAGMDPNDLKKTIAKNMATNMAKSTAKNWMRSLLSRFLKF